MSAVRVWDKFKNLLDVNWVSIADGQFLKRSGTNIIGSDVSGTGDVTGPASSVDSEVTLFSGATGKALKRATGTGAANVVNGVWQTPIDLSRIGGDPVGTIVTYVGATEPSGWHFCFGQAISRTGIYADLFAAIGTVFGVGDGSTTFNLPDFRGRVDVGMDDMGGTYADRMSLPKTVNTTNTSTTLTTTASDWTVGGVQRVVVGMYVHGAGIPAGTTVVSFSAATTLVMSAAATATASGITVRFSALDKLGLGGVGGVMSHQLTIPQMPIHSHRYWGVFVAVTGVQSGVNQYGQYTQTDPTGGDQAHPNTQPSSLVNKIIKYATSIAGAITPGTGDVVGPSSAVVDGSLALFDGTTGKQIKSTPIGTIVPVGGVVQMKFVEVAPITTVSVTAIIPSDGTIPQIGEGTQVASQVFTPLYANSLVRIKVAGASMVGIAAWAGVAVFRGGATDSVLWQLTYAGVAGASNSFAMEKYDTPATTSPITYTVRAGPAASTTMTIGFSGRPGLMITFEEIKQ